METFHSRPFADAWLSRHHACPTGQRCACWPDYGAGRRTRTKRGEPMIARWIAWLRGKSGSQQVILYSGGGMIVFLLWASLASVDEVTHGQGRVIPSSKAQEIG